jgi:hypothetical protein
MQDKSNTSLQQTLLKNETLPSHPFATSNFAARSQRFIQFKEKRPLIWILIEFIYRRVETTFDNKFNRSPNKNKEMIDLTYAYVQLCTHRPNHYPQGDVISSEQENSKRNQSNRQQAARLKKHCEPTKNVHKRRNPRNCHVCACDCTANTTNSSNQYKGQIQNVYTRVSDTKQMHQTKTKTEYQISSSR